MGARIIRKRDQSGGTTKETLTFWSITAVIVLPMVLAVALVGMDMRPDLSDLKPAGQADESGALPVGWPDLSGHGELPKHARMIGYMMDQGPSQRDGTPVSSFLLLPEAGHFLHPAHRTPDQSVLVWSAKPVMFRYRQMVWVAGTLNHTIRRSRDEEPAWAMISADVTSAAERDVGSWFRP